MRKHIALMALVAAALVPSVASAAARIEFTTSSATMIPQDGSTTVDANGPVSGERLRYQIVAKNQGDRPARMLAPITSIPHGQRYVAGSATSGAQFSTDDGKTWMNRPSAAAQARVTMIRWTTHTPFAPGAKMMFAYDTVVK
jgi:uncharacterized repeat protein (TIGR01451 family)